MTNTERIRLMHAVLDGEADARRGARRSRRCWQRCGGARGVRRAEAAVRGAATAAAAAPAGRAWSRLATTASERRDQLSRERGVIGETSGSQPGDRSPGRSSRRPPELRCDANPWGRDNERKQAVPASASSGSAASPWPSWRSRSRRSSSTFRPSGDGTSARSLRRSAIARRRLAARHQAWRSGDAAGTGRRRGPTARPTWRTPIRPRTARKRPAANRGKDQPRTRAKDVSQGRGGQRQRTPRTGQGTPRQASAQGHGASAIGRRTAPRTIGRKDAGQQPGDSRHDSQATRPRAAQGHRPRTRPQSTRAKDMAKRRRPRHSAQGHGEAMSANSRGQRQGNMREATKRAAELASAIGRRRQVARPHDKSPANRRPMAGGLLLCAHTPQASGGRTRGGGCAVVACCACCSAGCRCRRAAAENPLGMSYIETPDLRLIWFDPLGYLAPHAIRTFTNSLAWQRQMFGWTPSEPTTVLLKDFADYGSVAASARRATGSSSTSRRCRTPSRPTRRASACTR